MPEAKNNFLGGKMNKDLDKRLLQSGEYRDARNVSTSGSDSGNSGSIENVLGNVKASDFGITDRNIECIGYFADSSESRLFLFLTNYTDSSSTTQDNFASPNSSHYIVSYDVRRASYQVLVKGNFLNFSKTHRILHVNLLEDLLFWTDDRNQPRKINVATAESNSQSIDTNPYYSKEEHISVAKYYPYKPIRLYETTNEGKLNSYNHSLFGRITQIFADAELEDDTDYTVNITTTAGDIGTTSGSGDGATLLLTTGLGGNVEEIVITEGGSGFAVGDTITILDPTTFTTDELVITLKQEDFWINPTMKDTTSLLLPYSAEAITDSWNTSATGAFFRTNSNQDLELFIGCLIYVEDENGNITVPISRGVFIDDISSAAVANSYDVTLSSEIAIADTDKVYLGANPYYSEDDIDNISNIRDKFVRFAYRLKFDDNEYSLISPFTQSVFIPKQAGHFTGTDEEIDKDEQTTIESSNVDFFENSITEVGLIVDLPEGITTVAQLNTSLKVKEIDILYKDASEPSVKVVKTLKKTDIISNNTGYLKYNYKSTKPIKVLPERDIVRVFDKIPVRAKTQEVISNRVVYGNYIQTYAEPDSLDYTASYGDKGYQHEYDDAFSRREYPSHTLKQNRTYQVAIVLSDLFGRKSNPIVSDNSTVFSKYKGEGFNLISDADVYMGDVLRVLFNESIPEETGSQLYKGIYDETTNPMGWYSYQIVVKQKEQSYYNTYIPTILNGYPKLTTDSTNNLAHVTLVGDNLNKIPRDFELSADLDGVYRSKSQIYPRVVNDEYTTDHISNQYYGDGSPNKISLIGGRDELGLNKTKEGAKYNNSPFYSIPEVFDPASPDLLNRGSNPLIARVSTKKALGTEGGNAALTNEVAFDKLKLNVAETRPVSSNLELFWETSTAGLIKDINTEILAPENSVGMPYQIADFEFLFAEDSENGDDASTEFILQDFGGNNLLSADTSFVSIVTTNKTNQDVSNLFTVEKNVGNNKFKLVVNSASIPYYGEDSFREDVYDIVIRFSNIVDGVLDMVDGVTVSRNIVLKDNAMINRTPTFAENNINLGNVSSLIEFGSTNIINNYILTGWRVVDDLTITNGAIIDVDQQKETSVTVDRVEWYNTDDLTWYDYWFKGTIGGGAIYSRNPKALINVLIDTNGVKNPKLVYSPALQWGWFDRPFYSPPTILGLIDDKYQGEAPIMVASFNPLFFNENIVPTPIRGSSENFNYKEDLTILNAEYLNRADNPTEGYLGYPQFYDEVPFASVSRFRNISTETVLTDAMQVRVTFTVFDANKRGISKQFTALFDVNYGGYDTFQAP